MADYVLIRKSRNILSTILHILFNIALGLGSIVLTIITGHWALGILLVLLSKWRMFAVRPRYWFLNIKSNLVDLIVGTSFVLIAYCSGTTVLPIHYLLAIFYTLWLILLKPRSSLRAAEAQSLFAVFLGTAATVLMSASSDSVFMLLACFIIGYGASRHILVQTEDSNYTLITLICGLVLAEISWLCHSWLIVYSFGTTGIIIPQLSVIATILAFTLGFVYRSTLRNDGQLKSSEVAMPIIFTILILAIVIIWFSQPIFNV